MINSRFFINNVRFWFATFLACIVILPSGTIAGINVKYLSIFFFFLSFAFHLNYTKKIDRGAVQFTSTALFFSAVSVLFFINGIAIHQNEYGFREFLDILGALTIVICVYLSNKTKVMSVVEIVNLSFYSATVYSLIKSGLFLAVYFGLLDYAVLIAKIDFYLGIETIQYDYGNNIGRIQVSNDTMLSYVLFFKIITKSSIGEKWRFLDVICGLLLILAIFTSFARYYWLAGSISLVVSLAFRFWKMRINQNKFPYLILAALTILVGIPLLYANPLVGNVVNERLSGNSTRESDLIRQQQILYLSEEFEKNIVFGKGLGGNVSNYLRSKTTPYAYEVQWLAYMMKLGVLGTFALVLFLILPFCDFNNYNIYRIQLSLVYLVWLSSGFFNPNLASSVGGFIFGMFFMLNSYYSTSQTICQSSQARQGGAHV